MKELFASEIYGILGLFIFLALFIGMLVWVLIPSAKERFKEHSLIPLKDEEYE